MYLVRKIKKDLTVWSDKLKEFTLYEEAKVREVAKIICSQLESVDEGKMKIVKEKYSDEKYCAVGNIRVQRVQRSKTRVYWLINIIHILWADSLRRLQPRIILYFFRSWRCSWSCNGFLSCSFPLFIRLRHKKQCRFPLYRWVNCPICKLMKLFPQFRRLLKTSRLNNQSQTVQSHLTHCISRCLYFQLSLPNRSATCKICWVCLSANPTLSLKNHLNTILSSH